MGVNLYQQKVPSSEHLTADPNILHTDPSSCRKQIPGTQEAVSPVPRASLQMQAPPHTAAKHCSRHV